MSAQVSDRPSGEPITRLEQLLAEFSQKGSPPASWRIGLEHEKIGLLAKDLRPLPFDGPQGIEAVLRGLSERFGWTPLTEDGRIIALQRGATNITLEPGGQLELSGAPFATLEESRREILEHQRELLEISDPLGIYWLSLAYHPFAGRQDIPWMPKRRYRIMRAHMPRRGSRGLDMMLKTTTVQANLDYSDEEDAVEKLKVATALSPLSTALLANSPLEGGFFSGWLSTRMSVWLDTDPDRCGILPFFFAPDNSFRRYVEWALDVPMYLIFRDGEPIDMTSVTFRQFWQEGFQGHRALTDDWKLHLTTLFPDVRLKGGYIEVRGADMGPPERQIALGAFWKGLLYPKHIREEAFKLLADLSFEERVGFNIEVARHGVAARLRGRSILPLLRDVLALCREGLISCQEDPSYLDPLLAIVESKRSPAREILENWDLEWNRDPRRLVEATRLKG